MTARLSPDDLASRTLARQFPSARGTGVADLVGLYAALGPVQTQVPRAAFLLASSRLPGIDRDTVAAAFEAYQLVKGTNLRGTVHTSTPQHHAWAASVADARLAAGLRTQLRLERVSVDEVRDETARFAQGAWRERVALAEHVATWLRERETVGHGVVETSTARNLVTGHPALVRRPHDERWETRTDTLHRLASDVCPDAAVPVGAAGRDGARAALVEVHLRAYGPATRHDVAWWLGDTLGAVDAALERLGTAVTRTPGPDGQTSLDVADPPAPVEATAVGTRLLGEFDGLLLGYGPRGRDRFADPADVARLYAVKNGLLPALVLDRGRLVGAWRTTLRRGALDIAITPFPGARPPTRRRLADPVAATATVLGATVGAVTIARS